jgi:UDP-GlcNAc3NAcA epimerase
MPEEVNRVLTDHIADLLLAPTPTAIENLRREGLPPAATHLVGDCMYDVALHYGAQAEGRSRVLERLEIAPGAYVLATVHRAENTDEPARLRAIFDGLLLIAAELPVVLPLHPRTRAALERAGLLARAADRLRLIDPVGYLDMVKLERSARVIATDSGGVQKEAFFHSVPCVTLRDETEWTELVEVGANRLVSPLTQANLVTAVHKAMAAAKSGFVAGSLYGGGRASEVIVEKLLLPRPGAG